MRRGPRPMRRARCCFARTPAWHRGLLCATGAIGSAGKAQSRLLVWQPEALHSGGACVLQARQGFFLVLPRKRRQDSLRQSDGIFTTSRHSRHVHCGLLLPFCESIKPKIEEGKDTRRPFNSVRIMGRRSAARGSISLQKSSGGSPASRHLKRQRVRLARGAIRMAPARSCCAIRVCVRREERLRFDIAPPRYL